MLNKFIGLFTEGADVSDGAAEAMEDVGKGMCLLGNALQNMSKEAKSTDIDSPNRLTGMEMAFSFLRETGAQVPGK